MDILTTQFTAKFIGKRLGAIGHRHPHTVKIDAPTLEVASHSRRVLWDMLVIKLYESHEHISHISINDRTHDEFIVGAGS